ncbi:MAG: M20/M25/M40 family metallo-hydrolase [Pseudomonadota bacterium]
MNERPEAAAPTGRAAAIRAAEAHFDSGAFEERLARLVAIPTESQRDEGRPQVERYLRDEMIPFLESLGFACRLLENHAPRGTPVLLAERHEGEGLPTVLGYGHADVLNGMAEAWTKGEGPWRLSRDGDKVYGRGTADNKGQHAINITAQAAVIETRGRLGFNAKWLIEGGEETGSPGLDEVVAAHREAFAADVLIASDGPRLAPDLPTISLGCRGGVTFDMVCRLRDGAHHSGNWGGLIRDPAILLTQAIASITDARGDLLIPEWCAPEPSAEIKALLAGVLPIGGPEIDHDWGIAGLTPAERVYAANSFAVLAMTSGRPEHPVNAIAGEARATCQLRYIAGTDPSAVIPSLRRHLAARGLDAVEVMERDGAGGFEAANTPPDDPWAKRVRASLEASGAAPAILPQMGGSICNTVFTHTLGMPAIWVPHSYVGCSQHAPDEHVLRPVCREALGLMAGLYWDIGETA